VVNYTLAVLTHGRGSMLTETLRSFRDNVEPQPVRVLVHSDAGFGQWRVPFPRLNVRVEREPRPLGFCGATRSLWRRAMDEATAYVFWLEHDFRFLRPLDLTAIAATLEDQPELAQMALMRNAVNEAELAAGGLFESRRGEYEEVDGWLRHRSYFTTNPSLMRRPFMEAHPWPDHESECEGRYGLDLVAAGFSFGVWGHGEPWVEHVGIRSGFGY
jgi:hypothetical protein